MVKDLGVKENGSIKMEDESGYVLVKGNASICENERSHMGYISVLSKGTMELKGDLTRTGSYNAWKAWPGFRMVFSGERKQNVSIASYQAGGWEFAYSVLGDVTVNGAGLMTDTGFAA